MKQDTQATILTAANGSAEGRLHFGQVIELMLQAGVESYMADYRARRTTYYMPDGETFEVAMDDGRIDVARAFSADGVRAAVRGAQQGILMYPEFKRLTGSAGCVGYAVWIEGRRVDYFGRKGETHVERFPD